MHTQVRHRGDPEGRDADGPISILYPIVILHYDLSTISLVGCSVI